MRSIVSGLWNHSQLRPGGRLGWTRNAVGAFLGVAFAALFTQAFEQFTSHAAATWVVAPLGASAVLVFAVPASPLAQPWPVFAGNMLSAVVGMVIGHATGAPWLAASLAVGVSIAAMTLGRCLHPPGGACALLCALGAQNGTLGWDFLLLPMALNLGVLIIAGSLWNNATGHPWPHRPHPATPLPRPSYERADLDAVLAGWDETLDVDPDDLDALICAVEQRVLARSSARSF
jgi:CBS domain-containing membrane protein